MAIIDYQEEKVRTKLKEKQIYKKSGDYILEKVEYFKARGRKFIKAFTVNLKTIIKDITPGELKFLLVCALHMNKENIFYLVDIKHYYKSKNLYKFVKQMQEKGLIKQVEKGKYMINPLFFGNSYDTDINHLIVEYQTL